MYRQLYLSMATIILILFTLPTVASIVGIIMGSADLMNYGLLFYLVSMVLSMLLLLASYNKKIDNTLDKIDDIIF